MKKDKVVIIGKNYTFLLGTARAMDSKKFDVDMIRIIQQKNKKSSIKSLGRRILIGKPIEAATKFINKYYTIDLGEDILIETLLNNYRDYKEKLIIIPTDDFSLSTLDAYGHKLPQNFVYPSVANKNGELNKIMDKFEQKKIAQKFGLEVANGSILTYKDGRYEIPDTIEFPVFIKPQISFLGKKTIMKKCPNSDELKDALEYAIREYKCPILVEQYIDIEREYGVLGCSYNNNTIVAGMVKKIIVGKGGQKGVTLLGETSNLDGYEEIAEKIRDMISSLNFNGLFDVELYESNGKLYFSEINLRYGVYGYAFTRIGVNIPEYYINCVLGIQNDKLSAVEKHTFVNEKVCLDNYLNGYLKYDEYKEILKKADFCFTKLKGDMKPYHIFRRQEKFDRFMLNSSKLRGM